MSAQQKLIHEILPVGMLQCNCHIVGDPESREAIVIDPGDDAARILEVIKRHRLKASAIVITHAHIDHVVGLQRVHQATGAPVYMHAEDLELYRLLDQQAAWIGWKTPETASVDRVLKEGDMIQWGPLEAQVIHTPGHTPGSICLCMPSEAVRAGLRAVALVKAGDGGKANLQETPTSSSDFRRGGPAAFAEPAGGILFAGDTLFAGTIGRTDLWGGSFAEIMRSLNGKLLELPDDTIVYPGHGQATCIGKERETNPFLVGN